MIAIRRAMSEHGYWAVQVNSPWSNCCSPAARGKAPLGRNWQRPTYNPNLLKLHPVWSRVAFNTGVLLACEKAADPVQALDIDVDDAARVAALIELAREVLPDFDTALHRFRDNSPRPLFVARCEPMAVKAAVISECGKVERLAHGQQFVAFGIHASGVPLRWKRGWSPATVPTSDLPIWTEQHIVSFLGAVVERGILPAPRIPDRSVGSRNAQGGGGSTLRTEMRAKLEKHDGNVVSAILDLFEEVGTAGNGRHDALLTAAGLLVSRRWPAHPAASFLGRAALQHFTINIENDRDLVAEAASVVQYAAQREAERDDFQDTEQERG
jgi:hypothetical protein